MKTVQKLEISSGLVALMLSFGSFYILESALIPLQREKYEPVVGDLLVGLILDVMPALLTLTGSVIHIFCKSKGGLIAVIFFGTITAFLKGFMLFMVSSFYDYGQPVRILLASSCIVAMLTILFAFLSSKVRSDFT